MRKIRMGRGELLEKVEKEFGGVRHWKNGAKPMIDQLTMN
jgi:hypothetical protein